MGLLHPSQLAVEERFLKMNAPQILRQYHHHLDKVEARAAVFTEMQSYWSIPIKETGIVAGLVVSKGKNLVVFNLTCNTQETIQSSEHLIWIKKREEWDEGSWLTWHSTDKKAPCECTKLAFLTLKAIGGSVSFKNGKVLIKNRVNSWPLSYNYSTCNSLQLQALFLTQCILMLARCPELLKHVKIGNIQNLWQHLHVSACWTGSVWNVTRILDFYEFFFCPFLRKGEVAYRV